MSPFEPSTVTLITLFLLFPTLISGCGPGTGALGAKGTFQLDMIPPTEYTWSNSLKYGQNPQDRANSEVKADVVEAINQVLQANSIPTNDVSPPTVTYDAPKLTLTTGDCSEVDTVQVWDKKAYYSCDKNTDDTFSPTVYHVPLKVQITAVSAIYESQWKTLAEQVEQKLRAKRSAEFYQEPMVTVV